MLLAPWALWFAGVGAAVIALYILKIRRRRETVPALEFWVELAGRTRMRSLFDRLKRWLSLLLWLLIVALLLLALGNPVLSWGSIKPRSIAIILDNSASMTTLERAEDDSADAQPATRLDLAIDAIGELTSRRPVPDEWLLIEAGREPRVLQQWTRDRARVRDAAAAVQPFHGSGDLEAARELAAQLLSQRQRPTIVIVSDRGIESLEDTSSAPSPEVEGVANDHDREGDWTSPVTIHWPIGAASDNLGITQLSVRLHRQEAAHYAYIELLNAAADDIETELIFEIDGTVTAVEPVSIPAGATYRDTIALSRPEGGVLRVALERDDALAIDNQAFAVLDPIEPARVWLVTAPDAAFYFERALASMEPLVSLEESITMSADAYAALPADVTPPDLIIFNNITPATLPDRGAFMFIGRWPDDVPARLAGDIDQPELTLTQRDHPLTSHLNLRAARVARASRIVLPQPATVLARSSQGDPLIFMHREPDRSFLCLAFDVLESDLPLRNSFPLLLRNAVTYFAGEGAAWVHSQYRIGEPISPLRPIRSETTEVMAARLDEGDISETPIAVEHGRFEYRNTGAVGPLRFRIGDEAAYAAVNLHDAQETDNAPITAAHDPADALNLSSRVLGAMPWLGLTIIALLLIALEWLTYHYRWTE